MSSGIYLLPGTETTLSVSFDVPEDAEITPAIQYLHNNQMTNTNPWASDNTQFTIHNYTPGDESVTVKISNPKPNIHYEGVYLKLFDDSNNISLQDKGGNTISDPDNAYPLPSMRGKIDIANVTHSVSSSMPLNGGVYTIPLGDPSTLTVTLDSPNNGYSVNPVLVYKLGGTWTEDNPWEDDVSFDLTALSGNPVDKPKFTITVTPAEINTPVNTIFKIGLKLVNPDDNSVRMLELDDMKLAEPEFMLTITIVPDALQEKYFVKESSKTISYGRDLIIEIKDGYTVDRWYLDGVQQTYTAGGDVVVNRINPGVHRVRIIARDSEGYPYSNDMTITIE